MLCTKQHNYMQTGLCGRADLVGTRPALLYGQGPQGGFIKQSLYHHLSIEILYLVVDCKHHKHCW